MYGIIRAYSQLANAVNGATAWWTEKLGVEMNSETLC